MPSLWEIAGVKNAREYLALVRKRREERLARKPRQGELSPRAADRKAKGAWFTGYTSSVRVDARAKIDGGLVIGTSGSEYVLFTAKRVEIAGTLKMPGTRSIAVFLGSLHVQKLVFTDDVLVINGKLTTDVAFKVPKRTEGILKINGQSDTRDRRARR